MQVVSTAFPPSSPSSRRRRTSPLTCAALVATSAPTLRHSPTLSNQNVLQTVSQTLSYSRLSFLSPCNTPTPWSLPASFLEGSREARSRARTFCKENGIITFESIQSIMVHESYYSAGEEREREREKKRAKRNETTTTEREGGVLGARGVQKKSTRERERERERERKTSRRRIASTSRMAYRAAFTNVPRNLSRRQ